MEINLKITEDFDDAFAEKFEKFTELMAKEFYTLLTDNIRSNKFGFVSAAKTIRRKSGRNTPGIDTGELINSITIDGAKVFYREGRHYSGLSFVELGSMVEYGRKDNGFGGFPFWRKTIEEFAPILKKKAETFIRKNLFKKSNK